MKKVLFVLTMLLSTVWLHAQTHLELGLKGGLNIANLNQKDIEYDPRFSFNAGGFAHLHLAEHFAIQPELLYSSQGAKYTIANIKTETRLGYFALPVLLQYMTNSGFRLETGPQLGVLVSAKSKTGDDIKDIYEDIDFSWAFGASYLTASRFGVNARYNLGLNNVNAIENTPSIKNSVIQVGVFYQFKAL